MTTQEERDRAGVEMLADAVERWSTMPPLGFVIHRMDVYALILSAQAMQTHPAVPDDMKQHLEAVGRAFMERICDDAEVYAMLESGWHLELDIVPVHRNQDDDQADGEVTA